MDMVLHLDITILNGALIKQEITFVIKPGLGGLSERVVSRHPP